LITTDIKTVFIVDQGSTTRKLLAGRLQSMDFKTLEAGSFEEVSEALASGQFDLVVSDLELPGHSSRELFNKYKTLKVPLLVFTDRPPQEGEDWKIAQAKGLFHKSQRADLLKKILELVGWGAGKETTEGTDQKNILVIEDSPTIRKMVCRILEKNFPSCIIREACEGREALSEMSNKKVDLIFTDLQMPGMDGQTFLKMLHHNPLLKNKPVIVLSSSITAQLREELSVYESVRLLAKPSSAEEISETVRSMMKVKMAV
jgi:two-component system chemotaxis response regulator CheY